MNVWGHKLRIPESTSTGIARFNFDDLCGKPLGAADYLEITHKFPTLFVTDIPKLGLGQKDKVSSYCRGLTWWRTDFRCIRHDDLLP